MYGVDIEKSAVEDARRNGQNNGITNCVFVSGKAEDELGNLIELIDSGDGAKDKIVAILDPPRAGLRTSLVLLTVGLLFILMLLNYRSEVLPIVTQYGKNRTRDLHIMQCATSYEVVCGFVSCQVQQLFRNSIYSRQSHGSRSLPRYTPLRVCLGAGTFSPGLNFLVNKYTLNQFVR